MDEVIQTGSPNIVCNAWTAKSRAISLAKRKAHSQAVAKVKPGQNEPPNTKPTADGGTIELHGNGDMLLKEAGGRVKERHHVMSPKGRLLFKAHFAQ